jgi:hypothetical protein
VCILLVFLSYVYHDRRFRKGEEKSSLPKFEFIPSGAEGDKFFKMLHNTVSLEANVSSEKPLALYQSTRRNISEQLYLPDPIFI